MTEGSNRFCPECGAEIGPEARFCRACGAALKGAQPQGTEASVGRWSGSPGSWRSSEQTQSRAVSTPPAAEPRPEARGPVAPDPVRPARPGTAPPPQSKRLGPRWTIYRRSLDQISERLEPDEQARAVCFGTLTSLDDELRRLRVRLSTRRSALVATDRRLLFSEPGVPSSPGEDVPPRIHAYAWGDVQLQLGRHVTRQRTAAGFAVRDQERVSWSLKLGTPEGDFEFTQVALPSQLRAMADLYLRCHPEVQRTWALPPTRRRILVGSAFGVLAVLATGAAVGAVLAVLVELKVIKASDLPFGWGGSSGASTHGISVPKIHPVPLTPSAPSGGAHRYTTSLYSLVIPAGFVKFGHQTGSTGTTIRTWDNGATGAAITLDVLAGTGSARSYAVRERRQFSGQPSYREQEFASTQLAGRDAWIWRFTAGGWGHVSYLVVACGHVFGVSGVAPSARFTAVSSTFDQVAQSLRPAC